jgi:aspartate aminotransferase/N-succinyldiaminopimelate aminotransferase
MKVNPFLEHIPYSAFEKIEQHIRACEISDVARLHQGKTTFAPCVQPRDWTREEFELLAHEHAPPGGIPALRRAVVERCQRRHGYAVDESNILICAGGTHGVGIGLRAIVEPGDEVLVLSPQWLFAVGLVEASGAHATEVPIFIELARDPSFDFVAALKAHLTKRTRAIYFNTPNNPTGVSLDRAALERLAGFAEAHDLFVIADNAYENYDFTDAGFVDIATIGQARGRTVSVYSCSKTFAMPGYRVGYAIVPDVLATRIRKWGLYSVYSISTVSQFAALKAIQTNEGELEDRRRRAMGARDLTMQTLRIPHTESEGGLYTLLDLSGAADGAGAFVRSAVEHGVSLAPGVAFGAHCRDWARLCFTAVSEPRLASAIATLNTLYEAPNA